MQSSGVRWLLDANKLYWPPPIDGGRSSAVGSMKYSQDDWDNLIETYPPGTSVCGTVRASQLFGVFVLLDDLPDVPTLLEVIHFEKSESSPDQKIRFPFDYPAVGDRITARILAWNAKTKDLRLTQLSHLNWIPDDISKAYNGINN